MYYKKVVIPKLLETESFIWGCSKCLILRKRQQWAKICYYTNCTDWKTEQLLVQRLFGISNTEKTITKKWSRLCIWNATVISKIQYLKNCESKKKYLLLKLLSRES